MVEVHAERDRRSAAPSWPRACWSGLIASSAPGSGSAGGCSSSPTSWSTGRTALGEGCRVYPFACLGHRPQDLQVPRRGPELLIGRNNADPRARHDAPGTAGGGGVTRVGDDGLYMVGDPRRARLPGRRRRDHGQQRHAGGPRRGQDHAYLGGLCAIHQFVRIGRQAMIGGIAGVEQDVIPYGMVLGNRAYLNGLNIVGMKRRGVAREEIQDLRTAYRLLFAAGRRVRRAAGRGREPVRRPRPGDGDHRLHPQRRQPRRSACRARTGSADDARASSRCSPAAARCPAR